MKKKNIEPIVSAMGILTSIVTDLVKLVIRPGVTMEAIYRLATPEGAETLEAIAKVIVDRFNETRNVFLKLIAGSKNLTIEASDGQATIASTNKTFKSHIDSNFKNWGLNKPGQATTEIRVAVHEMIANATFAQMFGSLTDNLDKLVVSQSQIIKFCEKYATWLRQYRYGNFFLIKEGNRYFVVVVCVYDVGLDIYVRHLEDNFVWTAEFQHRLVTPQL